MAHHELSKIHSNLLTPLYQLLTDAQLLNDLLMAECEFAAPLQSSETESDLANAEARVQQLLNQVLAFEENLTGLITPDLINQLTAQGAFEEAQKIFERLELLNQSLLVAANREQDHLASELRQQVHTSKALDAYRR